MKNRNRIVVSSLIVLILTLSVVIVAQVSRPYRNETVWDVAFIKMKPGMETAYLNYIATDWKRKQEAWASQGTLIP